MANSPGKAIIIIIALLLGTFQLSSADILLFDKIGEEGTRWQAYIEDDGVCHCVLNGNPYTAAVKDDVIFLFFEGEKVAAIDEFTNLDVNYYILDKGKIIDVINIDKGMLGYGLAKAIFEYFGLNMVSISEKKSRT